ncbi:MAG: AMP-binding protein [Oscillospiraceae bacterium]|nr:AMP-binding protein [Oscillospiraceae bacterium]
MFQTIVEAVLGHAKNTPDKLAVCFKKQRLTYKELADMVRAFAQLLSEKKQVRSGDIIMISALSKPEYVVSYLAVQYLGATVVPADKASTEDSLTRLCHIVEPKFILTDSRLGDDSIPKQSLRAWYAEAEALCTGEGFDPDKLPYRLPDMNSISDVIFTTGTTGDPKGAMLSYSAILAGTINTRDGTDRHSGNIELLPLPLNHSFGLRVMRTLLYIGATVILQNGFMFAKELITNLEEYGCTGISAVSASVERLYQNLGDRFAEVFVQFKYMEISAGSLSVGMKQKLLSVVPTMHLYNVWGSSETGGAIFLDVTAHPEHIASLGKPANGVEVTMVDSEGNRAAAHTPETAGRMIMKGDMQMQGYYKQPDITAETIVDGYLYTGDLAYITEDGFVYMLGRADDIINVGGEKVSPIEVENAASLYEGIRDCACVGGADPEGIMGQVPVLFVVPEDTQFDENAATKFLSGKLEQYKLPKQYIQVDELPRNRMKKIDRKKLKQMLESGDKTTLERNPVISAIYGRRSVRDFIERRIPRELLEQLVECGYQAPSGHNMQSWQFTVITNQEEIKRIKETIPPVAKRNNVYFYGLNNPDAIIMISNDRRNPDGIQDSSCAAQNIMLAAHSYGLGSVWINALMKLCDEPEIRPMLDSYGVPKTHNVWAMIALGYPANRPSALAKKTNVVKWVE